MGEEMGYWSMARYFISGRGELFVLTSPLVLVAPLTDLSRPNKSSQILVWVVDSILEVYGQVYPGSQAEQIIRAKPFTAFPDRQ